MKKTREYYITGIRDILTTLGVTEFCWDDLNLGCSPILQKGDNTDNTFCLDWVKMDGVSGSSCWDEAFWSWEELATNTLKCIYNELSEYESN